MEKGSRWLRVLVDLVAHQAVWELAAGERIYFGRTSANARIRYSGGDPGGMMGGGQLACADCHCPDGRGGRHVMHMSMISASDIRWSELAEQPYGGHDDGEAETEHPPTIKRPLSKL